MYLDTTKKNIIINILQSSYSTDLKTAINEWEYIGLINPIEPVISSAFVNPNKKMKKPIVFFNPKTELFLNTSHSTQHHILNELEMGLERTGNSFDVYEYFIEKILCILPCEKYTIENYRMYRKYYCLFKHYKFAYDTSSVIIEIEKFLDNYDKNVN